MSGGLLRYQKKTPKRATNASLDSDEKEILGLSVFLQDFFEVPSGFASTNTEGDVSARPMAEHISLE